MQVDEVELLVTAEVAGDDSKRAAGAATTPNVVVDSCPPDADMESLPEGDAIICGLVARLESRTTADDLLLGLPRVESFPSSQSKYMTLGHETQDTPSLRLGSRLTSKM